MQCFPWLALIGMVAFISTQEVQADFKPLPPPPPEYVLDEPQVLSPQGLYALKTVLIEHDHLTGQQILVGILNERKEKTLTELSKQLYSEWKVGGRGQNNGVLITYFPETHETHLEAGYSLDSVLSLEQMTEITRQISKKGQADPAFFAGVYSLLSTLQSPLIETGKADDLLKQVPFKSPAKSRSVSNFDSNSKLDSFNSSFTQMWLAFFCLGIASLALVLNHHLSREAHFSVAGWYRPGFWDVGFHRKIALPYARAQIPKRSPKRPNDTLSPIVSALQQVENHQPYQLHLYLTQRWLDKNPNKRATQLYRQFGLEETSHHPAFLIYLNSRSLKILLVGPPQLSANLDRTQTQIETIFKTIFAKNLKGTSPEKAIAQSLLEAQTLLAEAFQRNS